MYELILWRHGEGSSFLDCSPASLAGYCPTDEIPENILIALASHPDFRSLDWGSSDCGFTLKRLDLED